MSTTYKLTFYVPATHLEQVKAAVFQAGAGRLGDYDQCAWEVLGQGQFRPLPGANPFLGAVGTLEQVAEYRVEMLVQAELLSAVIAALRLAHPYQTPAYDVVAIHAI